MAVAAVSEQMHQDLQEVAPTAVETVALVPLAQRAQLDAVAVVAVVVDIGIFRVELAVRELWWCVMRCQVFQLQI